MRSTSLSMIVGTQNTNSNVASAHHGSSFHRTTIFSHYLDINIDFFSYGQTTTFLNGKRRNLRTVGAFLIESGGQHGDLSI